MTSDPKKTSNGPRAELAAGIRFALSPDACPGKGMKCGTLAPQANPKHPFSAVGLQCLTLRIQGAPTGDHTPQHFSRGPLD